MSTVSISDPEIIYNISSHQDQLIRRIHFLNDTYDERCSMYPRSIKEVYPVSYTDGVYSGATRGCRYEYGFGAHIVISDTTIANIKCAMGRNNTLSSNLTEVYISTVHEPWTAKAFHTDSIASIETTRGNGIQITGRLELYLQFEGCSVHHDKTCYVGSHGKTWSLKGNFIDGSIDLIS